jgi:hypothetical protein
MIYTKRQYVPQGAFLTRTGRLVTLTGYLTLPYTLPEEYRPADQIFAPICVNRQVNYATIKTDGKITYSDDNLENAPIFISATWRTR